MKIKKSPTQKAAVMPSKGKKGGKGNSFKYQPQSPSKTRTNKKGQSVTTSKVGKKTVKTVDKGGGKTKTVVKGRGGKTQATSVTKQTAAGRKTVTKKANGAKTVQKSSATKNAPGRKTVTKTTNAKGKTKKTVSSVKMKANGNRVTTDKMTGAGGKTKKIRSVNKAGGGSKTTVTGKGGKKTVSKTKGSPMGKPGTVRATAMPTDKTKKK